ncbi:hypothetical protein ES703_103258 [subsurface metagenome]
MTALLNNPSFVHDTDEVGGHEALDAVGDDEGGAVLHQSLQSLPDALGGLCVYR